MAKIELGKRRSIMSKEFIKVIRVDVDSCEEKDKKELIEFLDSRTYSWNEEEIYDDRVEA